jgi:hypothetical protein
MDVAPNLPRLPVALLEKIDYILMRSACFVCKASDVGACILLWYWKVRKMPHPALPLTSVTTPIVNYSLALALCRLLPYPFA